MKKKLKILLLIVVVILMCTSAWFYGYYNHKSNDNLPSLTKIAQMSEADINKRLSGYKIHQLREVWGEPTSSDKGNTDTWEIGELTLIVSYNNNGVVVVCGLKDRTGGNP